MAYILQTVNKVKNFNICAVCLNLQSSKSKFYFRINIPYSKALRIRVSFRDVGCKSTDLHINYEAVEAYPDAEVEMTSQQLKMDIFCSFLKRTKKKKYLEQPHQFPESSAAEIWIASVVPNDA